MEIIISKNSAEASALAAEIFKRQMEEKPNSVLGLATGGTVVELYNELAKMCAEKRISFKKATSFNLDEYIGLPVGDKNSYRTFMNETFFSKVDIDINKTFVPDGNAENPRAYCMQYENKIRFHGGIDLQLLGIGADGHIGFNEPSSSLASRTRIKTLTQQTREDNARFFGGDINQVPLHAITMGVGTIMDARTVVLLAFGANKADADAQMVEGSITAEVPASVLQMHPNAKIFLDEASASKLKRRDYYDFVYANKIPE